MKEYKTITDFYVGVRDIANWSFALGEKTYEEKLARNIIRSLQKMFNMKVCAIEEYHNISSIIVDELICSLLTFEIVINDKSEKKNKGVAFKVDMEDDKENK